MNKVFAITATLVLLCLSAGAQADVFNLGAGRTNLETVWVGDVGNDGDKRYNGTSIGSVGYDYKIGKYEVTAGQYTDFLNNVAKTDTYGLYNTSMATTYGCQIRRIGISGNYSYVIPWDCANRPVNYVSYWDSCRFANWLGNGQGAGSTETGAYTLDADRITSNTVTRNTGAKWAVTSKDEWYKAAYYKGGGTNAGYWNYPTQSNSAPANRVLGTDPGNSANYYIYNYSISSPYWRTNVGEFENSASYYGTFDQGGNVWEWNDALVIGIYRGLRGGSFRSVSDGGAADLLAGHCMIIYPPYEDYDFGFRVSAVPEPSSIIALAGGLVSLLGIRRRKA